jgi:hypothetical protein
MIGGYIGYNYDGWLGELMVKVNEKRVERGLVPIIREEIKYTSIFKKDK